MRKIVLSVFLLLVILVSLSGCWLFNQKPVAVISASLTSRDAPLEVKFDASQSYDPDGSIVQYKWDFGDGKFGQGESIEHVFNFPGHYPVKLTVIDDEGARGTSNVNIIVEGQYEIDWSKAESNGWANPLGEGKKLITNTAYDYDSPEYLKNHSARHTGIDIHAPAGADVYSIAPDGVVQKINAGVDPCQNVIIIRYFNLEGKIFCVIYGHVFRVEGLKEGEKVGLGEKIGTIKKSGSPSHLHLGINTSSEIEDFIFQKFQSGKALEWGWGRAPKETLGVDLSKWGWVNPIEYLNEHSPATNHPPTATITSPVDGSTFTEGEPITFQGSATDPEDGPLTGVSLVWTSSIDGQIGTGESFTKSNLSVGTHTITLTATDSRGTTGTASITITITSLNIAGTWSGLLSQETGGPATQYLYKMVLFQQGSTVTGTSKIELLGDPQYYGVMKLEGTIVNNKFYFQETEILEEKSQGFRWCIKKGVLTFTSSPNVDSLSGSWEAPGCSPGEIYLEKQI